MLPYQVLSFGLTDEGLLFLLVRQLSKKSKEFYSKIWTQSMYKWDLNNLFKVYGDVRKNKNPQL